MPVLNLVFLHPKTRESVRFWVFLDRQAQNGCQWSGKIELRGGQLHALQGGFVVATSGRSATRDDVIAAACAEIAGLDLHALSSS